MNGNPNTVDRYPGIQVVRVNLQERFNQAITEQNNPIEDFKMMDIDENHVQYPTQRYTANRSFATVRQYTEDKSQVVHELHEQLQQSQRKLEHLQNECNLNRGLNEINQQKVINLEKEIRDQERNMDQNAKKKKWCSKIFGCFGGNKKK